MMDLKPLLPRRLAKLVSKSTDILAAGSSVGEFLFVRALGMQKHSTLTSIHILDRAVLLLVCAARGNNPKSVIILSNFEAVVTDSSAVVATGITLWFNSAQALVKKGFHLNNLFLNCINIILGYTETSQSLAQGIIMIKEDIYPQVSWLELSYGLACFVVIQRATVANTHKISLQLRWDSLELDNKANSSYHHPNPQLKAQLEALADAADRSGTPVDYQIKITESIHRSVRVLCAHNPEPILLVDKYQTTQSRNGVIMPQQDIQAPLLSHIHSETGSRYDTAILQTICTYRRYQSASYGRSFLHYSGLSTNVLRQHEHTSFAEYVGIPPEDIIASSYSSGYSLYRFSSSPLIYFISISRATHSIVVSLRGTFDLQDVLTDAMFHYSPFITNGREYKAHCGMLRSARLVLRSLLMDQLIEAMGLYPEYGLVVLGHSLGAGVAAIFSIMISEKLETGGFVTNSEHGLPSGRPIQCIAYAPPATVCLELSDQVEGLVTSVIYTDDAIPHLSIGVLWDLRAITMELREHQYQFFKLIKYLNGPQGDLKQLNEMVEILREKMTSEKLIPPGRVYRIDDISKTGPSFDQLYPRRVIVSQVTNKRVYFNEPIFSRKMFHHTSNYYERSLDIFVKSVLEQEQQSANESFEINPYTHTLANMC